MLSVRPSVCLSVCLFVCDVRALWPNGWTDQDATGMELGLSQGDFVLDGTPLYPPQKRGQSPLPNFRSISIEAKCKMLAPL